VQRKDHAVATREEAVLAKRKKTDLVTQECLLTYCWGVGKNQFNRIKKEIDRRAIDRGISCNLTRSVLMTSMLVEEEDKVKTVIDNQEVCDRIFTTKRLFCNNWVRQRINESPVDREGLSVLQQQE